MAAISSPRDRPPPIAIQPPRPFPFVLSNARDVKNVDRALDYIAVYCTQIGGKRGEIEEHFDISHHRVHPVRLKIIGNLHFGQRVCVSKKCSKLERMIFRYGIKNASILNALWLFDVGAVIANPLSSVRDYVMNELMDLMLCHYCLRCRYFLRRLFNYLLNVRNYKN